MPLRPGAWQRRGGRREILDLRMPRKDGLEVVIELMSKGPHPGIIVLSKANVRAMDEFMDSLRDQVPGGVIY
jgi:CheY-like chemotaxis protein